MKGDGADCCIDMLDEEQTLGDASSIPLNAVDALNGRIARETGGVEDADAVALLQGVVADGLYADGAVDGQRIDAVDGCTASNISCGAALGIDDEGRAGVERNVLATKEQGAARGCG